MSRREVFPHMRQFFQFYTATERSRGEDFFLASRAEYSTTFSLSHNVNQIIRINCRNLPRSVESVVSPTVSGESHDQIHQQYHQSRMIPAEGGWDSHCAIKNGRLHHRRTTMGWREKIGYGSRNDAEGCKHCNELVRVSLGWSAWVNLSNVSTWIFDKFHLPAV